jgi:hypothetical protein
MASATLRSTDLSQFRRDLGKASPGLRRALTRRLQLIAKDVGMVAREYAERDVSTVGAKGIKWSAARDSASIYVEQPFWMRFHNDGFFPGGADTFIPGAQFMERAAEDQREEIAAGLDNLLEDTVDEYLAKRK